MPQFFISESKHEAEITKVEIMKGQDHYNSLGSDYGMFHIMLGGFHIMISGFHIILSGFHVMFGAQCQCQWKHHNAIWNVA